MGEERNTKTENTKGRYFRPVVNPKIRDGLFKEVLRKEKNVSELYELVYNETLFAKDIEIKTLDSTVLYRARYNDISFVANEDVLKEMLENSVSFAINEDANNDKLLLVLVEHQSTEDQKINTRIKEYADDFIELYNKDKEEHGEKIPTDITVKGVVLYNGRNLKAKVNKEGRLFECEGFENQTGIEIKHVNARYEALLNRFGENKKSNLHKLSYFFQEFDKEINRLNKAFNIKEVTDFNAESFDETRDELIKQKKAEIGMTAYMNARQQCKDKDMLIDELKGIKALITESERERVTMPENFWEDIERAAEEKAEKNRITQKELAGTQEKLAAAEEDATRKLKEILNSESSSEIKEIRLNDLRDTVARIVGTQRFNEILKDVSKSLSQANENR